MKKPTLPPETDAHYYTIEPVYDHYKTVRVADYCEHCSQKTGYHEEQRGVKIVGYKVNKNKKDVNWHTQQFMLGQVVGSMMTSSPFVEMMKRKTIIKGLSI